MPQPPRPKPRQCAVCTGTSGRLCGPCYRAWYISDERLAWKHCVRVGTAMLADYDKYFAKWLEGEREHAARTAGDK